MYSAVLALAAGMLALAQAQESISTKELAPPPGLSAAPAAPAIPPAGELREIGSPPDTASPTAVQPTTPSPVTVEEAAPAEEKKTVPKPPETQSSPQPSPRKPEADKSSPKEVKKRVPAPQQKAGGRRVAAFWVILPPL